MAEDRDARALVGAAADLTGTERVVRATLEHRVVNFIYQGLHRTAEPHLVGIHETGEVLVVAYQTGGASKSGDVPGWRTFTTTEMDAVEIADKVFPGPRPDFNPAARAMVEIFARA
jgi:hypothetical protein